MHKTLARQVDHHVQDVSQLPLEVRDLLDAISVTYENFDQDRLLVERSLEVSSQELRGFISLLQATLDSTSEGILVVNTKGQLMNYNRRFVEIWEVPDGVLNTRSVENTLAHVFTLVTDPLGMQTFVAESNSGQSNTNTRMIKFKDGKTVELSSRPQLLDGKQVGIVWSSRDVTELLMSQEELRIKLDALERLNRAMIDRELKMIELKKKIAELEAHQ